MCLQYIFADSAGKPHPFNVKSNWQPLPQPSVVLEGYLERTKFEIASITFSKEKDNLSARQREALKTLSANKEKLRSYNCDDHSLLDFKIRSSIYGTFHISLHIHSSRAH